LGRELFSHNKGLWERFIEYEGLCNNFEKCQNKVNRWLTFLFLFIRKLHSLGNSILSEKHIILKTDLARCRQNSQQKYWVIRLIDIYKCNFHMPQRFISTLHESQMIYIYLGVTALVKKNVRFQREKASRVLNS